MITPADIGGDEVTARRVLVLARTIAPCLDALEEQTEPWLDAVAVLTNVAAEARARGARHVQSQSIGPARVAYEIGLSAFTDDDRDSLRALCAVASSAGARSRGAFPKGRPVGRVWPEGDY